jgi:hypothetical protein
MALISLVVADVVLYFAASVTSQESPTHPPVGTAATVFGWLFWAGVLALIVLGGHALVQLVRGPRYGRVTFRDRGERLADTYLKAYPGVGEEVAAAQLGAESYERQLSEQGRVGADHGPSVGP